jgi:hypothetical protein
MGDAAMADDAYQGVDPKLIIPISIDSRNIIFHRTIDAFGLKVANTLKKP